jgi:hypothetical protein
VVKIHLEVRVGFSTVSARCAFLDISDDVAELLFIGLSFADVIRLVQPVVFTLILPVTNRTEGLELPFTFVIWLPWSARAKITTWAQFDIIRHLKLSCFQRVTN